MRRMFPALLMTAALAAPMVVPTSVLAGEPRANATITLRIYDPYRRDYHVWDQREERAYRGYLAERHRSYVTYQHQRLAHRRAYWRWRHEREERFGHERRWRRLIARCQGARGQDRPRSLLTSLRSTDQLQAVADGETHLACQGLVWVSPRARVLRRG